MKFVAYYRVSTDKQGKSGLGLEAQKRMVANFVASSGGELKEEFEETESGKNDDRPELQAAIRYADLIGAKLVVGKLDRLSRDLLFLLQLQKSKVDFVVADLPGCDSFTVSIYGALAQRERELISSRTKEALAAAKARGVKLGKDNLTDEAKEKGRTMGRDAQKAKADKFAAKVLPMILKLQEEGKSLRGIADKMNKDGIQTARGGNWTAVSIGNVLKRSKKAE